MSKGDKMGQLAEGLFERTGAAAIVQKTQGPKSAKTNRPKKAITEKRKDVKTDIARNLPKHLAGKSNYYFRERDQAAVKKLTLLAGRYGGSPPFCRGARGEVADPIYPGQARRAVIWP